MFSTFRDLRVLPLALLSVYCGSAGAVIVTNSSFEDGLTSHPNYPGGAPNFTGIADNTAPDGWRNSTTGPGAGAPWSSSPDWIESSEVLWVNNPVAGWASDGTVVMGLDAYTFVGGLQQPYRGGISQVVSGLVPGREYTVQFDAMRHELQNGPATIEFDLNPLVSLLIDGVEVLSTSPTGAFVVDFDGVGAEYLNHSWQTITHTFMATSASHDIGFLSDSSDSQNPLLLGQVYVDNVSVVPEPGVSVLALIGGLLLIAGRRRS